MRRVIVPHPIASRYHAYVETLKTSRSVSSANNVWRHFSAFFVAMFTELGVILQRAGDDQRLSFDPQSDHAGADATEAISQRLKGLLPEEATALLGRAFAGKAKSAVYNAAADVRTFLRWAVKEALATLDPEKVVSPLDEQDSLPISQAWLEATYPNKGTRATRKTQFRIFFTAVAKSRAIVIDLGAEARAYEALRRSVSCRMPGEAAAEQPDPDAGAVPIADRLQGTLTRVLCREPDECVRILRGSVEGDPSAEAMLESYLSTVRRFYVWAHSQRFVSAPVRF